MNRYTAAGLHAAALNGETITVLAITLDVADEHFRQYLEHVGTDATSRVSHVNGRKHVRYPSGGTIHFTSYGAIKRGTSTPAALCYDWRYWHEHAPEWSRAHLAAWATHIIPADA